MKLQFETGSVVRFRNRNWIVEPSRTTGSLSLKPLGFQNESPILISTEIIEKLSSIFPEEVPVPSSFPLPDPKYFGDAENLRITFQAFRLLLRDGTAPFRSFGKISILPRKYQLLPLLLALRQDVVRLLIADDVGVGKTIEAILIVSELLERGITDRFIVLCPPSLCDQWQKELLQKFGISAEIVRSSTITRLERMLPPDTDLFRYFKALVVSVDLMKSAKYRPLFLAGAPDLVVVDEVHTMAKPHGANKGDQLRYELISELARKKDRHLIYLSATPHNGHEDSFLSILGFLKEEFLSYNLSMLSEKQKRTLSAHFIQRRRIDIRKTLQETTSFPEREDIEISYKFSKEYRDLFMEVSKFAREKLMPSENGKPIKRMDFYSALSLLRSISSSPAQAIQSFLSRNRKEGDDTEIPTSAILDGAEEMDDSGSFPLNTPEKSPALKKFIQLAERLTESGDEKLESLQKLIKTLLEKGYSPIIWCRFIRTAEYLGEKLSSLKQRNFRNISITVVTGKLTDEERKSKIEEMKNVSQKILIATDCLSEGINLQDSFDSVVHYDLPWNPNRMEQREGRVDRFGQKKEKIPVYLLYGKDNPMDGVILDVLLRKARAIHKTLGIQLPLPLDSEELLQTILQSVILKSKTPELDSQFLLFDKDDPAFAAKEEIGRSLERLEGAEKSTRSRYAHRTEDTEGMEKELITSLEETERIFGGAEETKNFILAYFSRMGKVIQKKEEYVYSIAKEEIPEEYRLHLRDAGGKISVSFRSPEPEGSLYIGRTHPILESMAESVLTSSLHPELQKSGSPGSRLSCVRSVSVETRTLFLLYRFRFEKGGRLAEEPYLLCHTKISGEETLILPPDSEHKFFNLEISANAGTEREVQKFLETALLTAETLKEKVSVLRKDRLHSLNSRGGGGIRTARGVWKLAGESELIGILVVFPV